MAIYKLKDVCEYIEGYVNPIVGDTSNFVNENGMPWLKVSELKHGSKIYHSKFLLSKKAVSEIKKQNQIFKKGTIVWSKSGSIGITSLLGMDATANRGIINIIPMKNILNKYLFYYLLSNKDYFSSKGSGGVLKHLYGPKLMEEEIFLPSIDEQQKIIDIIEPHEDLFRKYSNLVSLSSAKNCANTLNKVIDIIEPLEAERTSLENKLRLIRELTKSFYVTNLSDEILGDYSNIKKLSKLIKKDELSEKGKYHYISGKTKKDSNKTNEWNVDSGISISYEASVIDGDFLCAMKHDERSYVGRKWHITSNYENLIYLSIINSSKNYAEAGVKMPKLPLENLSFIKIIKPTEVNEEYSKELYELKSLMEKSINSLNATIEKAINFLLTN